MAAQKATEKATRVATRLVHGASNLVSGDHPVTWFAFLPFPVFPAFFRLPASAASAASPWSIPASRIQTSPIISYSERSPVGATSAAAPIGLEEEKEEEKGDKGDQE